MISNESFFDDVSSVAALWCPAGGDRAELARSAQQALSYQMALISALPDDVAMLWTWLEKTSARVYARFYLGARAARDAAAISDLSARVNAAFKQGASGAQIFLPASDLDAFAQQIGPIRDDLFFNRDLCIGLDISDVDADSWGHVFEVMGNLRVSAVVLALSRDGGVRSDFVGRVYAALGALGRARFDLHFVLGARPTRIEQAMRLVRAMRPEMDAGMRVFIPATDGAE